MNAIFITVRSGSTRLPNKATLGIGDKATIGAENHKVIFIHPRSTGGILVELAEKIN